MNPYSLSLVAIAFSLSSIAMGSMSPAARAADGLTIYKCTYTISSPGKIDYVLSGNVIANDAAGPDYSVTYLTLAPNEVSGAEIEARILITSDGFNPMTLHKPGLSVTTLAHGQLAEQGGELSYVDSAGSRFSLVCVKR